jgi:hypothetical protein
VQGQRLALIRHICLAHDTVIGYLRSIRHAFSDRQQFGFVLSGTHTSMCLTSMNRGFLLLVTQTIASDLSPHYYSCNIHEFPYRLVLRLLRWLSSELLRRVVWLKFTNVSEALVVSIIRAIKITEFSFCVILNFSFLSSPSGPYNAFSGALVFKHKSSYQLRPSKHETVFQSDKTFVFLPILYVLFTPVVFLCGGLR